MALCMMLTGMVSGKLEDAVGYKMYFVIAVLAIIPSLLVTWFAPFNLNQDEQKPAEGT